MDARAADFRDASALADDAADIELGRGIVATRSARAFGCQNAVGADDCVRVGITHEQMIAEAIELVGVDSARGQVGMQTLSVDPPAQPLRLEYLRVVAREPDAKARLLEARLVVAVSIVFVDVWQTWRMIRAVNDDLMRTTCDLR